MEANPDFLNDLTLNQKRSFWNVLYMISMCDGDLGNIDTEIIFLNRYIKILGVNYDDCVRYFKSEGDKRMISDLKPMKKNQKEFLAAISWELIICDAKPNEKEVKLALSIFEDIGISVEEFDEIARKAQALIKLFLK